MRDSLIVFSFTIMNEICIKNHDDKLDWMKYENHDVVIQTRHYVARCVTVLYGSCLILYDTIINQIFRKYIVRARYSHCMTIRVTTKVAQM